METPRLNLPLIAAGQAQKHVPANESFKRLDALVNIAVISMAETDPPAEPDEGDMYIAGPGATGAWENGDLNLFLFTDGIWLKIPPFKGMIVWDRDHESLFVWGGASWLAAGAETVSASAVNFNNATARLPGDPDNVQAAVTGAAAIPMAKAPPEMTWVDDDEISIAAGRCRDEDDTTNIVLPDPITIDNISVGNDAHRYVLVGRDGDGDPIAELSESIALPTAWQAYRCIGSILTDGSGDVVEFTQVGDLFRITEIFDELSKIETQTFTFSVPPNTYPIFSVHTTVDSDTSLLSLTITDATGYEFRAHENRVTRLPSGSSTHNQFTSAIPPVILVDANSQVTLDIGNHESSSAAWGTRFYTAGWIDRRRRDK